MSNSEFPDMDIEEDFVEDFIGADDFTNDLAIFTDNYKNTYSNIQGEQILVHLFCKVRLHNRKIKGRNFVLQRINMFLATVLAGALQDDDDKTGMNITDL